MPVENDIPTSTHWGQIWPSKSLTNKIIVLDLDENLVHTYSNPKYFKELGIMDNPDLENLRKRVYTIQFESITGIKGDGSIGTLWGVERPHLSVFLIFCFYYFDIVCVWSAGVHEYVHKIVRKIFKSINRRPDYIFTRDDCETGDIGLTKPLTKLAAEIARDRNMNPKELLNRMYMMDDKHYTFDETNPDNGILTPAYSPDPPTLRNLQENDDTLLILKEWLLLPKVMTCSDIKIIEKGQIFEKSLQEMKRIRGTFSSMNKLKSVDENSEIESIHSSRIHPQNY